MIQKYFVIVECQMLIDLHFRNFSPLTTSNTFHISLTYYSLSIFLCVFYRSGTSLFHTIRHPYSFRYTSHRSKSIVEQSSYNRTTYYSYTALLQYYISIRLYLYCVLLLATSYNIGNVPRSLTTTSRITFVYFYIVTEMSLHYIYKEDSLLLPNRHAFVSVSSESMCILQPS
jgi:hypothetical protein